MKFNEQYTVENHIIKFLKEKLGYEYIKPADFEKLRELEREYIVVPLLRDALAKINSDSNDTEVQEVIRRIKNIDRNQDFLEVLRYGIDIIDSKTRLTKNYKIIDFDKPSNNHLVVTNQFYFEGNAENIRPDILIFINGIPVVDIEAKSATAEGVSFENGIDQIKRYEKNARNLFIPNCFNIATDGFKTVYGPTYSAKQYFLEWKAKELEEKLGGNLEMTLASLLESSRLCDLINNFIVFEKSDEGEIKKMARYQQLRATNKMAERFEDNNQKRGLIWHTQGSGKSLTMFFTAWKIRYGKYKNKELSNPKVLVLVDRIDLDDQIYETFINCGGKNVVRVESREHLRDIANSDDSAIFISTIQKFDETAKDISNPADNIAVLIDEAHRGQYKDTGIYLRSAFPNATLFAFTGTPIFKTHQEFGLSKGNPERYLDYYSINQAIEDGVTVPITYEARLSKFAIDEKAIDEEFDLMTSDLSPEEKKVLVAKFGRKTALIKLPKRMKAIAKDIYEHYMANIAPNGFKAQVVCYDREATAMYKEIFDGLMLKEYSEVVYSAGDPNEPNEELKKYVKTKQEIKKIINRFKDPNDPLKFLLVCDMLLTGFDAPVEQAMYLDKPLWGHNLLQAVARTNRVELNKVYGRIIDYYGITRNLVEALDFDEREIDNALINIEDLKGQFIEVYKKIEEIFKSVNTEDPSMENLRKCLAMFASDSDKKNEFEEQFKKLRGLFEVLSPDVFLKDYIRKIEWFACFYVAYQKEYGDEAMKLDVYRLVAEYGAKLRALVKDKVDYEGITRNYRELRVDQVAELEKRYGEDDEEKAKNLERMLKSEISINIDTHPLFRTFAQKLEAIRQEFENRQTSLLDKIKKYEGLIKDIQKAQDQAGELGLNLKEFALYGFSEEYISEKESGVLKEYVKELEEYLNDILEPLWQETSRREDLLKDIKQTIQRMVLQDYSSKLEVKEFSRYLNRLVDVILKKWN